MSNLLVITNGYPQLGTNRYINNFVKEFTDLVSNQFDEIYVISPQPYFPKFLRRFKIFEKFYRYSNFENYNYGNIKVFYPIYFSLPLNVFRDNNRKKQLNKIKSVIKKENLKFDIIHCHFCNPGGLIGSELKKDYEKLKVIVHCHDSSLKKDLKNKSDEYIKMFKGVDETISFCEHYDVLNKFYEKNEIGTKNVYIPNFVNTEKFYPKNNIDELRMKYGFKFEDKILICVGNLIFEHKGQNDFLDIRDDISEEVDNIHLILIGDGQDKQKMLKTINELKYKGNIHYLGSKSNEEIVNYLNISDLFIFPSRYESFGIVQIEAISCGIPVITYKNGGSEYVIKDEKVGIVLDKQDVNLLKEGILKMLYTKYDREYLHKYIVDRYSGEIIKKQLANLYFNKRE